jgi:hypothetical protein
VTEHIVSDSGARESFTSGMVRDTREGKGRFELITPVALRRLALVYERGAAKYQPRNWEKGSPLSRFADSAQRHLNDYQMIALYKREGIPLDRLPGDVNPNEDHLAQAVWNLCCIMHHEDLHPDLDDLNGPPVIESELNAIKPGMTDSVREHSILAMRRALGVTDADVAQARKDVVKLTRSAQSWGWNFTSSYIHS